MMNRFGVYLVVLFLSACAPQSGDEVEPDPPSAPPTAPPATPPSTPPPPSNTAPSIETTTLSGREGVELSVRIAASDSDGDEISFSLIEGPDWLQVSPTGEVSGMPDESAIGTNTIEVEAHDGQDASRADISITIAYDPLEQALRTGDYKVIEDETSSTLSLALLDEIDRIRTRFDADIAEIFQLTDTLGLKEDSLTSLTWEPDQHAAWFIPETENSVPLFISNATPEVGVEPLKLTLGVLGRTDESRFIVLGDNPMRAAAQNPSAVSDDMQQAMMNMIKWLIGRDPENGFKVVFNSLPHVSGYPDNSTTRAWFDETYGSAVETHRAYECQGHSFADCITDDVDLIVLSTYEGNSSASQQISERTEQAMRDGVPVLYMNALYGFRILGRDILNILDVEYQWNRGEPHPYVSDASPIDMLGTGRPDVLSDIAQIVSGIENDNLNFDLTACGNNWHCPEDERYNRKIATPLQHIYDVLGKFVAEQAAPFPANETNARFHGLLILIGDYYRSQTAYPMNKVTTPSRDIIRSLFGDVAALIYRKTNPVGQLGTFSRNEFPDEVLKDKRVQLKSLPPFRTTGVYAVPGKTVTVTRNDASDVVTYLKVHSLRPNANGPFKNDFDRPVTLSSRTLEIAPGETLEFTSAFGGPIQVYFNKSDLDVDLEFQNIGQHPVWRGQDDTSTFIAALKSGEFDWAELVTPNFEIHSTLEKMRESINESHISTPGTLAELTKTYLHDWRHWLAGWDGDGIRDNPDLQSFAAENGLTIPTTNVVKHMNADRPACSSNCAGVSGNPYDALWNFDPVSLGDLHEFGHGLEYAGRHRFDPGSNGHATTNLYVFHSQSRFFQQTGEAPFRCFALPHERLYGIIQASRNQANPALYMLDQDLSHHTESHVIYLQLFAALENQEVFDDGWKMMPRLHLVSREFGASNTDAAWREKSAGLGFSGMSRQTAFSLPRNDWLLIALSWSAQRDLREYLSIWGFTFSDDALDQVASMNLRPLNPAFYAISESGHCRGLNHPELPIDGSTPWPTQSVQQKSGPFTPDYLAFDHGDFCTLENHEHNSETSLMSLAPETY